MRIIKIFIFLTILVFSKLFSQIEFDYSGYVVNIPSYNYKSYDVLFGTQTSKLKVKNFINLTRFRFRPVLYLWDGARINLEYESNVLYNDSKLNPFGFNSSVQNQRQIADLNWELANSGNLKINHFIDRLYLKQRFDFGNIIVGRQRIAWGTGRIWNPTDLFNPINPVNFSKIEKDGADAVTSKIIFGDFTDLQLVFNPNKLIKKSNYAFRFRSNYKEYDFSIVGGVINDRTIAGFDFAGNFLKAGLRGEFLYSVNKNNSSDDYFKFIVGLDYQLTKKLYTLVEYQYNGEGKDNKTDYELLKLTSGEIINLAKNYLAISAAYEYSPLLKFNLLNNLNLNDQSGFVSFSGNYSIDDDIYALAGLQISYGKNFTEYFYFPHSFYLKLEYYF